MSTFQVPLPLEKNVKLSKKQIEDLILLAKDFVTIEGGLLRSSAHPDSSDVASHVPFLLFPTAIPRNLFEMAQRIQLDFQVKFHIFILKKSNLNY